MNYEQKNKMSRAGFIRTASILTAGTILVPRKLFAQESPVITIKNEAAKATISVQALRGNILLMQGSGGNIAVFNGPEGLLMVDGGIAVSQQKIIAALNRISNKPIKYLINTHWHFDHAEGNEWIQRTGATIIAHENTKKNLGSTITVRDWNYTFTPAPKGALPALTMRDEKKLRFNSEEIQMKYYKPAHTDCDISVYFPEADILHVGDTWWNAHYPFIDHDSGGTMDGMIAASNHNLSITTDKTLIIPGHGAAGNRNQLRQFRDMLVSVREKVAALKKAGRTMQETVEAKPTAAFDAQYGNFVLNGAFFTKLVYADV